MARSLRLARKRVRQTLDFANGPRLLLDLAASSTPLRRPHLRFEVDAHTTISCPNVAGARVPVYEVFAEDAYRIDELAEAVGDPTPVVLDIGGQVGCFSVAFARRVPGASVHAYEASPATAEWLRRNVSDNALSDRVTVHAQAVSARTGTLELLDNGSASGLNGLTAVEGTRVSVPCVGFRDAVEAAGGRVDLVKLDTEGAEYSIVLGSDPADWTTVEQVVMEYHDVAGHSWAELRTFFADAGLHDYRHDTAGDRQGTVWLRRTPTR